MIVGQTIHYHFSETKTKGTENLPDAKDFGSPNRIEMAGKRKIYIISIPCKDGYWESIAVVGLELIK